MIISADWLPVGPNATPEEAATVARIRITIGNLVATEMRIEQRNDLVSHIVAPAYPLAEAIAWRWWTLLYGRGRATRLRSMRDGFVLPEISIVPMGDSNVEIRCKQFRYDNPPVQFVTEASETIPVVTLDGEMRSFVAVVLTRLKNEAVGETLLANRWSKIEESEADKEERAFCVASGALGVDPYTCSDAVANFIESASKVFENDNLEEFLAGVSQETGANALSWLKDAESKLNGWAALPAIMDCRKEIRFRPAAKPPWTAGYESARKVRKFLALSETEPVGNLGELSQRLGNPRFHATEAAPTGLRGVSYISNNEPEVIVAGSRNPANLMFAVARTFGDAIHFGSARRSPVTDQQRTYRQALGRAFAAEFLAPVRAVLEMHEAGEPIEEIAANFGVQDKVIEHQIENKRNALAA